MPNEPTDKCQPIYIHAYGMTRDQWDKLFDRVADAAHDLDEEVSCSGGEVCRFDEDEPAVVPDALRPVHYREAAASLRDLAGHSANAGASDDYIEGINHAVAWLDSEANDQEGTDET